MTVSSVQTGPLGPALVGVSVVVTGGAGFLGSELVNELLARGARVSVIDNLSSGQRSRLPVEGSRFAWFEGDGSDLGLWKRVLASDPAIERIVHLAGTVGVRRVLADPEACLANHRQLAQTLRSVLLEWQGQTRPAVVCASSSEVYRASAEPLDESSATWQPTDANFGVGRWAYASAKLATEQSLLASPAHVLCVRLFNVVGPGQEARSGMVLPRFVEAARAGRPLSIYGDGLQLRTYGHVRAVALDLATLVLARNLPRGVLNLGGTAKARAVDLAAAVLRAQGLPAEHLEWVDALSALGQDFEEVRLRVPNLALAQSLGLVQNPWSLEAIVQDALSFHPTASVDAVPHRPRALDDHRSHFDAFELGRTRETGPG